MPVYNAAETLVQTLESIAGQSFEDFEVVAVDDGSEDGSGEILQGWVEKDCRFRVLLEEHRGIAETPNRGLGECRGEFVARMAADDKMHPQRLDKQVGMLDGDEGLSVVSCLVAALYATDIAGGGGVAWGAGVDTGASWWFAHGRRRRFFMRGLKRKEAI